MTTTSSSSSGSTGASGCSVPTDCPYDNPGCLGGTCGGCSQDTDCPTGLTCGPQNLCVCSGGGCGGDAPVCLTSGFCGCGANSDCGGNLVCDPVSSLNGVCKASCVGNTGICTLGAPDCETNTSSTLAGVCVPCTNNTECADNTVSNQCNQDPMAGPLGCVQCLSDATCSGLDAGTPFCGSGTCAECRGATDCGSPDGGNALGCNLGTCGNCVLNSDCVLGDGCSINSGYCETLCQYGQSTANCAPCAFANDCLNLTTDGGAVFCVGGECSYQPDAGGNLGNMGTQCGANLCFAPQICNTTTSQCVNCLTNTDCTQFPGSPICDATGNCAQCAGPTDCPYDLMGCFQGTCGACGASTDCPTNDTCADAGTGLGVCECGDNTGCGGDAPVCAFGSCVCSASTDCDGGAVCDGYQTNPKCVAPCTTTGCNSSSAYNICDTSSSSSNEGVCVQCLQDGDCQPLGQPHCGSNVCGACSIDSDCAALSSGTPYCTNNAQCVECTNPSQCSGSAVGCNYFSGQCGSCFLNTDCPSGMSCNAQGQCS